MKQERVFTCPETEDLTGTCHLCGHGIERHGPDYECYEKPITQKKHNMDAKHTAKEWKYVFEENGGYDCMTGAFKIMSGDQEIASLDLFDYGQKSCQDFAGKLEEAEANARLIASCPNLFSYVECKAKEGCEDAKKIIESITGNPC